MTDKPSVAPYIILPGNSGATNLIRVKGIEGEWIGMFSDMTMAARVATLLNRHGLVDAPMPETLPPPPPPPGPLCVACGHELKDHPGQGMCTRCPCSRFAVHTR